MVTLPPGGKNGLLFLIFYRFNEREREKRGNDGLTREEIAERERERVGENEEVLPLRVLCLLLLCTWVQRHGIFHELYINRHLLLTNLCQLLLFLAFFFSDLELVGNAWVFLFGPPRVRYCQCLLQILAKSTRLLFYIC